MFSSYQSFELRETSKDWFICKMFYYKRKWNTTYKQTNSELKDKRNLSQLLISIILTVGNPRDCPWATTFAECLQSIIYL